MSGEIVDIGPHEATIMLRGNGANRPLSAMIVRRLADEMSAGRWVYNGDPIRISPAGQLIDGQHRLHAVIRSGVMIRALVLRNIDAEVFDTIDSGKPRTVADALSVAGYSGTKYLSAVVKMVMQIEREWDDGTRISEGGSCRIGARETMYYITENPSVCEFAKPHETPVGRSSIGLAVMHIAHKKGYDCVADFWALVHSGAGLSVGAPALILRNTLMRSAIGKSRLTRRWECAAWIRAFIAHTEGRTLQKLYGDVDGLPKMKAVAK